MDALLKFPLIMLLLVACMQAYPAGNKQRDWPYSSSFKDGPYRKIVSDPQTTDGEGEPDKLNLYFNFRFNVPFGQNNPLGVRGAERRSDSLTTEGGRGGGRRSDSLTTEGGRGGGRRSDSLTTEDEIADKALHNPDLFEGDIVRYLPVAAGAVSEPEPLWLNGKIPYVIGPRLKHREPLIKEAMKHYEDRTCIRFVPRTDEKQYVLVYEGGGCYSDVGQTQNISEVSLASQCHELPIILHELGHAVGIDHEHSRSDRDDYLNIHHENIEKGMEYQFEKLKPNQDRLLTPFDFDSIMLYGEKLASKNNMKTMTAKDGRTIKDLEEKSGLSKYDIERINKLYKC